VDKYLERGQPQMTICLLGN